ncbi:MAG: hypothetical protein AAGI66_05820 [Cyanobacteria bacterium P01_H01_bin.74]
MSSQAHEDEHAHNVTSAEGRFLWFFQEFWPLILLGSFFLIMCALPLILSGMLSNPFSASDIVWAGYGLLLIAEFIGAVVIICLMPKFLGIYLLMLSIYGLIFAENFNAYKVGFISDGQNTWMVSSIAILFLTYLLIGNLVFINALWNNRKTVLE